MELDPNGSPTSEISRRNMMNDEQHKENCAAHQFFSSLLESRKLFKLQHNVALKRLASRKMFKPMRSRQTGRY
jgi:hypothetical protein